MEKEGAFFATKKKSTTVLIEVKNGSAFAYFVFLVNFCYTISDCILLLILFSINNFFNNFIVLSNYFVNSFYIPFSIFLFH